MQNQAAPSFASAAAEMGDPIQGDMQGDVSGHISRLLIYPIKSCAGIELQQARLDATGLQWDRAWMLVDDAGVFLTQRSHPRMALIQPSIEPDALVLNAPGMPELRLPLALPESAPTMVVKVWKDSLLAHPMGHAASDWFSRFMGEPCHLVRFGNDQKRQSNLTWTDGEVVYYQFADGFPLLIASQASMDELNSRLLAQGHQAVGIERFRPNIVFEGLFAHDEDRIVGIRLQTPPGAPALRIEPTKPCTRCPIPDIDPATAISSPTVSSTLVQYRQDARVNGGITFGMNARVAEGAGSWLEVGQAMAADLSFD